MLNFHFPIVFFQFILEQNCKKIECLELKTALVLLIIFCGNILKNERKAKNSSRQLNINYYKL